MRVIKESNGLFVRAIAGTQVVILAMNMSEGDCDGLLGFAIHRTDHEAEEAYWLQGVRTFAETDPGLGPNQKYSSREHPFQDFTWSDYTAKEGRCYTYRVIALKGSPRRLTPFSEVKICITTESPADSDHDVYFNRGASASQEYARRFGNKRPVDMGGEDHPVWAWLSRGAHEAILGFIARATSSEWGLRVCAYEFRLPSVAKAIKSAADRGADIKVLYDGSKEFPADDNRKIAGDAGLTDLCTERVPRPIAIPHNKFIVLTKGTKAIAVMTGSTNFSTGGVFGQSNVVHVVEDEKIATSFLDYWNLLAGNPRKSDLAPVLTSAHPLSEGLPPHGTTTIFSPRSSLDALEYYFHLAGGAQGALFITFPFGMHDGFKEVFRTGQSRLRYALMDKLLGPGVVRPKKPTETEAQAKERQERERAEALAEMLAIRKMVENRIAVGSRLPLNLFDQWVREQLTGLNEHVQYIHTKYMLIDPLGNDPIVISGSANFSTASTNKNDENMLVIRGNKRVADIYLGEYMRLWDHYAFREWATAKANDKEDSGTTTPATEERWHLQTDNSWWQRYFGNGAYSRHREYFAG